MYRIQDKSTYDNFAASLEKANSDVKFVKVRDASKGTSIEAELKHATKAFSGREGRDGPTTVELRERARHSISILLE